MTASSESAKTLSQKHFISESFCLASVIRNRLLNRFLQGPLRKCLNHKGLLSAFRPPLVIIMAAVTISPPPIHAKGLSLSPSSLTPSMEPIAGSIFRKTPARDAGTREMPQFHKNIALVLQSRPLASNASQAWALTPCTGGRPLHSSTHSDNISVPLNKPYAVTCNGECVRIKCLFNRTHARAISRESTTSKSPASVGPCAETAWLLLNTIMATPAVDPARASQPRRSSLSCTKIHAPLPGSLAWCPPSARRGLLSSATAPDIASDTAPESQETQPPVKAAIPCRKTAGAAAQRTGVDMQTRNGTTPCGPRTFPPAQSCRKRTPSPRNIPPAHTHHTRQVKIPALFAQRCRWSA